MDPAGPDAAAAGSSEGRIARSFLALASGDALARVIAFGAAVYVARSLGAPMFGVIGFASAVVLYFAHMSACGIELPAMRDVADDPGHVQRMAPGILTVRLLVSVVLALVLAVGSLLLLPMPESIVLALYGLTLLAHGANPRFIHLGLQSPRPVAIARTLGELTFLLLVLLMVREPLDIATVPWAQFIGDLLATILMVYWLRKRGFLLPLRLDWERVKPVFRRSFPLVVNILLGLMIYNSDLIFLWLFRGTETVGYYTASYQLISFLINMAWAYSFSLLPALTQAAREREGRDRLFRNTIAQTFAVSLPVAVGGALLASPIIALVFGEEYEPSGLPLAILVASVPFMLFKDIGMVALIVSGRERVVMKMTAVAMVFNLLLNLLVIPRYGIAGAACTTLATEVLRAVLAAICVRIDTWPFVSLTRLWRSLVAAAVMAGALLALAPDSFFVGLPLGIAAYLATLAATGGIELRRGSLPSLRV